MKMHTSSSIETNTCTGAKVKNFKSGTIHNTLPQHEEHEDLESRDDYNDHNSEVQDVHDDDEYSVPSVASDSSSTRRLSKFASDSISANSVGEADSANADSEAADTDDVEAPPRAIAQSTEEAIAQLRMKLSKSKGWKFEGDEGAESAAEEVESGSVVEADPEEEGSDAVGNDDDEAQSPVEISTTETNMDKYISMSTEEAIAQFAGVAIDDAQEDSIVSQFTGGETDDAQDDTSTSIGDSRSPSFVSEFTGAETDDAHDDNSTLTGNSRSSPIVSILRLAADFPPTKEPVLSPHSEASRLTDIASNQTSTATQSNKFVHWSMSLDALSSEGDFAPCGSSSKSVSSTSETTGSKSPLTCHSNATDIMESYNRKLAKEGCSGQLGDLTATWVARIKKDWQYIESASFAQMKDDFVSWTESGVCSMDTTLVSQCEARDARDVEFDGSRDGGDETVEERDIAKPVEVSNVAPLTVEESPQASIEIEAADVVANAYAPLALDSTAVDSCTETVEQCGSSSIAEETKVEDNVTDMTDSLGHKETTHLHEDVYKERDYLREWKLDAEETMKCQDVVSNVLREQKSSLLKQCNELERAVRDLKEWKFGASDDMKVQSTQLADLMAQKTELVKQCEQNQESIQELSNWKFAAEDALNSREAELEQVKAENSFLSKESREQREAIKALTEWKIESMETMKNQLAELESTKSESLTLTTQCKTYEDSIHQLTSWKSDNEPVMKNHAAELKRLSDENAALISKCDDQHISIDRLSRWKMNAEEEMKKQLAKLESFEKQVSELTSKGSKQEELTGQLAKWKSEAEDTIKKQINTIDELSRWKATASGQATELTHKIESLEKENADLTKQCNELKASIEELTAAKLSAEKNQLAEIENLKAQIEAGLNDDQALEELTKWKSKAEATMKEKETELAELQSHYLIFGKQCNEQKELIKQREEEIKSLTKETLAAATKIKALKKDNSRQATKINSYEDIIQTQTDEIAELKAEIAKLKDHLENEDQPHKQEVIAMKMAHHKELLVLKTERHMLASKIQKLVSRNEDLTSKVTDLNVEKEEFESKYLHEKEGHDSSKIAVKKLEKSLKSSEKKRQQLEKKLASDADFCDILSQRLNEGL